MMCIIVMSIKEAQKNRNPSCASHWLVHCQPVGRCSSPSTPPPLHPGDASALEMYRRVWRVLFFRFPDAFESEHERLFCSWINLHLNWAWRNDPSHSHCSFFNLYTHSEVCVCVCVCVGGGGVPKMYWCIVIALFFLYPITVSRSRCKHTRTAYSAQLYSMWLA